jgi:hypothetical protein
VSIVSWQKSNNLRRSVLATSQQVLRRLDKTGGRANSCR